MGNIDDVVPFFGRTFNKIYPLIMVVYTLLVAGNFFEHLIDFFGSLKRFKCWTDQEEDMDGLDPSGVFILQKGKNFIMYTWWYLVFLPHMPPVIWYCFAVTRLLGFQFPLSIINLSCLHRLFQTLLGFEKK